VYPTLTHIYLSPKQPETNPYKRRKFEGIHPMTPRTRRGMTGATPTVERSIPGGVDEYTILDS
jgi:hypothetical protein